jgi:hypothetical protein
MEKQSIARTIEDAATAPTRVVPISPFPTLEEFSGSQSLDRNRELREVELAQRYYLDRV